MTAISAKHAAKEYAGHGFPVIPLYPILVDESGRYCPCGTACGRSAGKHPIASYAPHGANSATTDQDLIDAWPDECNVGLGLSETLVGIDIDDVDIAEKICNLEDARDSMCIVLSGRGLHLYARVLHTPNSEIKTSNGRTIGSIRAKGHLTVLPPSTHLLGVQYRWFSRSIAEWIPTYAGTGYGYAREILASVGVTIAERHGGSASSFLTPMPDGGIQMCDLPFEIDMTNEFTLYQLSTGMYPTSDRSTTHFRLACEAYRAARRRGVAMPIEMLAGYVKKVDSVQYKKYVVRSDGDKQLWTCASRAMEAVAEEELKKQQEEEAKANGTSGVTETDQPEGILAQPSASEDGRYYYDEKVGFVYKGQKGASRICNFEPKILEVLEIWNAEEEISNRYEWHVKLGDLDLTLGPEEYGNPYKFREAIQSRLGERTDYIVEDGMWGKLLTGMQHMSLGSTVNRRAYVATGWLPDRDAFLLPGPHGAITADGYDQSITFDNHDAPPRLRQYGDGVVPSPRTEEAIAAILACAPSHALVPLLSQALAAPLSSLGIGDERTVVHMFGKTGNLKTSLVRVMLCMYGRFARKGRDGIDGFSGTNNFLESTLHQARDLPVLIDDYKVSLFARNDRHVVIRLIQNYADGTARGRLNRNQRQQPVLAPRCLLITTGEDIWEAQQSSLARTLVVEIPDRQAWKADLARVQLLALEDGVLGSVGYEWIRWLCGIGREQLRERIDRELPAMRSRVEQGTFGSGHHERTISAVANLLIVSRMFAEFLDDRFPATATQYRRIAGEGWKSVLEAQSERTQIASSVAPLSMVVSMIVEAMGNRRISLSPKYKGQMPVGTQGAEPIGFWSASGVYLTESTAWAWFQREAVRRGEQVGFSWGGFVDDARRAGATVGQEYFHGLTNRVRAVMLPPSILPLESIVVEDPDVTSWSNQHESAIDSVD